MCNEFVKENITNLQNFGQHYHITTLLSNHLVVTKPYFSALLVQSLSGAQSGEAAIEGAD